jgi:hypothetical protein
MKTFFVGDFSGLKKIFTHTSYAVKREDSEQCCGSGSGIRCLVDPGIRIGKNSESGSGIRIRGEQPGSYFREFKNNFWG